MNRNKLSPKLRVAEQRSWLESVPLQVTALVLLVLIAYWNSLSGGFHFDDQAIFLDPYIMGSGFGWKILRLMQTRPLTFLSFHWSYLAGGGAPKGFHIVNVLLHAANTVMVMLVARRTLRGPHAFLAGALFAIHPIQTEAVNYVFQRATLLAAFLALLSLLLYMHEKYPWAVVAFGLSLLAKEETIALPALLFAYDLWRGRKRTGWKYLAGMLGMGVLVTARLIYVLHRAVEPGLSPGIASAISYALTECRVVWVYLRLFILPTGLCLDHDVERSLSLLSPLQTLPALLMLMLVVGWLTWLAWRGNTPAFWALGFFILLSPSSSVIPAADLIFEHRTYFPLACLTIAAACLLARFRLPPGTSALAVSLLLIILLAGTIGRNRVWHDEHSLWTNVIEESPRKPRGYFQLAQSYALSDPGLARELYERGLEIEPESSIGHANLGLVLLSQNEFEAALMHLRRALALGGVTAVVLNNIGSAEVRRGEVREGIKYFQLALEKDPCRFDARWNLIHTLSSLGERDGAFQAGRVPPNCQLRPDQVRKLEDELVFPR